MILFAIGGFVGAAITLITISVIVSGRDADNYYRAMRRVEQLKEKIKEQEQEIEELKNEKESED